MSEHPTTFTGSTKPTYTKTHYGTALFHIPGGSYSIADLEKLVEDAKAMRAIHDKHLAKSMGESK